MFRQSLKPHVNNNNIDRQGNVNFVIQDNIGSFNLNQNIIRNVWMLGRGQRITLLDSLNYLLTQ